MRHNSYYGYSNDDKLRMSSSSGGMFSLVSDLVIKDGGVVYGAAFDYKPVIKLCTRSTKEVDIEKLRKSKYVQAFVGISFREIKENLKDGKKVFFCGTPCQVDGLIHYLGRDYENLITADFVCHGVPPVSLLRAHLDQLGIKDVVSIDFRPKHRDWVDDIVIKYHDGNKEYCSHWSVDSYFWLFQKYKSLRRSCYNCKYCNGYRASDLTLADFWGYRAFNPKVYNQKGLSLILTNTTKGESILKVISEDNKATINKIDDSYSDYVYEKVRYEVSNGYNLTERNEFYDDYMNYGLMKALDINGYSIPSSKRLKFWLKSVLRKIRH